MKQISLLLLSPAIALAAIAQDYHTPGPVPPDSAKELRATDSIATQYIDLQNILAIPPETLISLPTADTVRSISFRQPYSILQSGNAVISAWDNGAITAHGSTTHMPGLMGIERGRLNMGFTTGNITYNIYGEAIKYGYFNGLQTSYGIGADVTYRFSDKLSMTVFASCYSPVRTYDRAAAGFINSSRIGGYFDYSFSSKFGVQVGAQSYKSVLIRHWETQPIIKPYYKISSKASIGIDVGGIIYQILKTNVGKDSWGTRNPTVGPPVMKLSEMTGY